MDTATHVLNVQANKQRCVIRACAQKQTLGRLGGVVLRDGYFKCWMSAPEERKEVQEKQDLHKRVGMDIEDGWHLHKHINAHVHSPAVQVLRSSEGTEHKRNGPSGCGEHSHF